MAGARVPASSSLKESLNVRVGEYGEIAITRSPHPALPHTPLVGLRSHTNTMWLRLECAAQILAPVVEAAPADAAAMRSTLGGGGEVPQVEGLASLAPAHADAVGEVLRMAAGSSSAAVASSSDDEVKTDGVASDEDDAGSAASKKLTGKVAYASYNFV